jgi:hypothetical protein
MANNDLPEDLPSALQDPIAKEQLVQYVRILLDWDQRRNGESAGRPMGEPDKPAATNSESAG